MTLYLERDWVFACGNGCWEGCSLCRVWSNGLGITRHRVESCHFGCGCVFHNTRSEPRGSVDVWGVRAYMVVYTCTVRLSWVPFSALTHVSRRQNHTHYIQIVPRYLNCIGRNLCFQNQGSIRTDCAVQTGYDPGTCPGLSGSWHLPGPRYICPIMGENLERSFRNRKHLFLEMLSLCHQDFSITLKVLSKGPR